MKSFSMPATLQASVTDQASPAKNIGMESVDACFYTP
jgi:hypothetical protein